MPFRPQAFLACIDQEIRVDYMEYIIVYIMYTWPGDYYATEKVYRAAACLVYVWVWQLWALLTGILLTLVAIIVWKFTNEWRYAVVLGVCGWTPTLLLGGILLRVVLTMAHEYNEALKLSRAQRQRWRAQRRQERRREQELMAEFNASLAQTALGEAYILGNVPAAHSDPGPVGGSELAGANNIST